MRAISKRGKIAEKSAGANAFGNAVADLFIDVAPVFECTLQHWLRHDFLQMSHSISWSRRPLAARRFWDRMKCWNFIRSRTKKAGVLFPTMSSLPSEVRRLFGDTEKVKRELEELEKDHATWNTDRERKDLAHILGTVKGLEFDVNTLMADRI